MTTKNLLKTALKTAEPVIQEYVRQLQEQIRQLKTGNTKLQKQMVSLEIKNLEFKVKNKTYKNRISALQKALDKSKSNRGGEINLIVHRPVPPSDINK